MRYVNLTLVRVLRAVSQVTWMMPSDMEINTYSVTGYNNNLKKASAHMKLGVNNSINVHTKKVGVKLMSGGGSRFKKPTPHPSNLILSYFCIEIAHYNDQIFLLCFIIFLN